MNTYQKIRNCYYLLRANWLATRSHKVIDYPILKYGLRVNKILDGKKKYDHCVSQIPSEMKIKPYVNLEDYLDVSVAFWPYEIFHRYINFVDIKKITPDRLVWVAKYCGLHNANNWNRYFKILDDYQSVIGLLDVNTKSKIFSTMITTGNNPIEDIENIRSKLQITRDYDGTNILLQNLYGKSYNPYINYLLDNLQFDFWKLEIKQNAKPSACKAIIQEMINRYDRETVKQFVIEKNLLYEAYYGKFYRKIVPSLPRFFETES